MSGLDQSAKRPSSVKRPYSSPKLTEFGTLREITLNIAGGMGMQDNSGTSPSALAMKTSNP